MADRLDELQSAIHELGGELRRLEARVGALEGRAARALPPAADGPPELALPALALPQGTLALVGRSLLILAGAFIARALTDGRLVPAAAGVALGLGYAALWQLAADREAASARRTSATLHSLTSSLIAYPLIWETTARLGLLGPRPACAVLVLFFALGLSVAWHRRLAAAAAVTTALTLLTSLALLVATRDLLAVFFALFAIAGTLEAFAYKDHWLASRWWAAAWLDAVAFLLAVVAARPQGMPEGYVPLSTATAVGALLALPALYVVSLAGRTVRRGRPLTLFEGVQGTLAVLLGFGGAWRILLAHGGAAATPGALALLLGALCYGTAFAFAERRPGQGRNFYFYSTAGGLLTLAGVSLLAFGRALPFVMGGLGLASALCGRRFGRTTLRVHSALYLTAGALGTGLVTACLRAFAVEACGSPSPLAWLAALTAAAGWAVLASDPAAPRSGPARAPQLALAVLVVLALGKAAQLGLWAALGEGAAPDAGPAAVARTGILAALALGLATASRRVDWPELGWLVYPLVALGGLKLLVQDVRHGRPATLVASLALYGAVLVLAPRIMKSSAGAGAPAG